MKGSSEVHSNRPSATYCDTVTPVVVYLRLRYLPKLRSARKRRVSTEEHCSTTSASTPLLSSDIRETFLSATDGRKVDDRPSTRGGTQRLARFVSFRSETPKEYRFLATPVHLSYDAVQPFEIWLGPADEAREIPRSTIHVSVRHCHKSLQK